MMNLTSDLTEFGPEERAMLIKLLTAWETDGLPEDFTDHTVTLALVKDDRRVILKNVGNEVAMMNGDKLVSWYDCQNCSNSGFIEECRLNEDEGCNKCNPQDEKIINEAKHKHISLRIPVSVLEKMDAKIREKPWMNRTYWIMDAIKSKLDKED